MKRAAMNGHTSFDPRDFVDKLKREELESPLVLPGMVKPADDSDDYILFAYGSACQNWVRIPLTTIDSIDLVNLVPCNDHTHPFVLLRLKPAATDEGRLFASLMQASAHTRGPMRAASEGTTIRADRTAASAYGPGAGPGARRSRIVRGPRAGGSVRAADDPGITAEPRWPWCSSVPDVDIDAHGVWCLDWCWESEHQASYMLCDDLRTLTTE
jgi:hypothetical protein